MHESAMENGKDFFEIYCSKNFFGKLIVDIGAQDVNGSLRQFCPDGANYIGVDFVEGNGVDVVITDPYKLPFEDGSVDVVVCSSVFEHSEFFWILFLECIRLLKSDGLLYLNAPSNGFVHRYPVDSWRFYPDAGKSLVNWARRNSYNTILLESFISEKKGSIERDGMWNDFVAVVLKDESYASIYNERITNKQSKYLCGYSSTKDSYSPVFVDNADRSLILEQLAKIVSLNQLVAEREGQISSLNQLLTGCGEAIQALRNSTSWRLTKPIRFAGHQIARWKRSPRNLLTTPQIVQRGLDANTADDGVKAQVVISCDMKQDAAFEVLSGLQSDKSEDIYLRDQSKLIAFYLPQYHRIAENSEWWGPGFTEWTNVVKGKPNFEGHYQPHLPRELGFYDLSNVEVIREQAEMAKLYGINGFCFYYYWFSGRRILEEPIDKFLASDIEIDYCLCWANENWTRTWDGDTRSVLMHQKYEDSDALEFITSLLPHFSDRRYIQVNGKPMLVVYRAKDIPNTESVFSIWRKAVADAGFVGLHISVVDFYDITTPTEVGADALVEFPPHKFNGPQGKPDEIPVFTNSKFHGGMVDYAKMMAQSAARPRPDFNLYRGIIPSWDNTARRQDTSTIIHGANPELFREWLKYLRAYNREYFPSAEDNFIFINAWNEWGEGCHLEPDQKWGLGYLEAVARSAFFQKNDTTLEKARNNILNHAVRAVVDIDGRQGISTELIDKTLGRLTNIRPVSGIVQKIAFRLREYPLVYRSGRYLYRVYRIIFGGRS